MRGEGDSPDKWDNWNDQETGTGAVVLEWKLLYDNNGNLVWNTLNSKRQYIYSYDYKNRLIKIKKIYIKRRRNKELLE